MIAETCLLVASTAMAVRRFHILQLRELIPGILKVYRIQSLYTMSAQAVRLMHRVALSDSRLMVCIMRTKSSRQCVPRVVAGKLHVSPCFSTKSSNSL